MLKIPYGISDYKKLIEKGYYYVDKTMYLQKLEDAGDVLTYLRPGRFGKTLFTSMMYYYYDINSKDLFDDLFKNTYIYNNPTKNKNNYYILKLDFSGITASSDRNNEQLEESFKACVVAGILRFLGDYGFDYQLDKSIDCVDILKYFLTYIYTQKLNNKIYLIIDEYDNFTNAVLKGEGDRFREILSSEGFIHAFYANIKQYTGTVIDRVFITGICSITLDSMTTGFNISKNISSDLNLHSMIGLTHDEVTKMLNDFKIDKCDDIYDIMLKNYDGYLFNEEEGKRVFNATLVMYFLDCYCEYNKIPKKIIDDNIAFNYNKIGNIVTLQDNEFYHDVLDTILKMGSIEGVLKTRFNLEEEFDQDDIISLLYYFGYLTIDKSLSGKRINFIIPNYVMSDLYYSYFTSLLKRYDININKNILGNAVDVLKIDGDIKPLTNYIESLMKEESNRVLINFDEKYIQLYFTALLRVNGEYTVYSEYEVSNGYVDLMLLKDLNETVKYEVMVEFKYIPVKTYRKNRKILEEKKLEAKEQLIGYSEDKRFKKSNLKKFMIIFIGKKVKVIEEV